ncbi:FkbM family methyltransferase [Piscinibacter terrae]|nr:FkbM family methyltransferase [Albitalea terrae]
MTPATLLESEPCAIDPAADRHPRMHRLAQAKAGEISSRGLMSFPTLSPADASRIEGVEAVLACAAEPIVIQLPRAALKVRFDPRLPAELLYYLAVADYEQSDLDLARDHVCPGERVMEIGAGIGVTGCALARASGVAPVLVEPNPVLWEYIEANFKANQLPVELVRAAAVPSTYGRQSVDFHTAENYWWSSLKNGSGMRQIEVPAVPFARLLAEHQPQVLAIDIEGAEDSLVEESVPDCVRKVLIEIHTPSLGSRSTCAVVAWLQAQAFQLVDLRAHTWVFKR